MPTKIKESWEERFSELFYKEFDEFGFKAIDTTHDDVRDFIRSERIEAKREERERIVGMVRAYKEKHPMFMHSMIPAIVNNLLETIASSLESSDVKINHGRKSHGVNETCDACDRDRDDLESSLGDIK